MMFMINFYVPASHLELVKDAMFNAGAGNIGPYRRCAWQVEGEGQFQPEAGSNPYLGKQQQLEKVAEYKVEMVCADDLIEAVVTALLSVHPYETPAYQVWPTHSLP